MHGIPERPSCSTTATSSRSTAGRSSRAGTPTPRSPSRSATIDDESQRLLDVTRASLEAAIEQVAVGQPAGRHRRRGRGCRRAAGFTVVREYVGHGIGTAMHEEPAGPELRTGRAAGCKLQGGHGARHRADGERREPRRPSVLADGWTVVTARRRRSAHFEHTVAVTDDGPEVLTAPDDA